MNDDYIREELRSVTGMLMQDYARGRGIDKIDVFVQPDTDIITDITKKLLNILFPGYYREKTYRSYNSFK